MLQETMAADTVSPVFYLYIILLHVFTTNLVCMR